MICKIPPDTSYSMVLTVSQNHHCLLGSVERLKVPELPQWPYTAPALAHAAPSLNQCTCNPGKEATWLETRSFPASQWTELIESGVDKSRGSLGEGWTAGPGVGCGSGWRSGHELWDPHPEPWHALVCKERQLLHYFTLHHTIPVLNPGQCYNTK